MKIGMIVMGVIGCLACGGSPGAGDAEAESAAASNELIIEPTLDMCRISEPDAIIYMNNGVTYAESKSGSGEYYYDNTHCTRWLVDFKMATYSTKVLLKGAAFDLPSSAAAGGAVPATQEDCKRFSQSVTFYRKRANETSFTNLGGSTLKGSWAYGQCSLYLSSGSVQSIIAPPSTSGWDTYRVSVGVKLRSTWQEVRATASEYIPPPA